MGALLEVVEAAESAALVSVEDARAEVGVEDDSSDARLLRLIATASATLATLCNRPEGFGRETLRETFDAEGEARQHLTLGRDIAPAVLTVTEDGTSLTSDDWMLEGPRLWRRNASGYRTWWAPGEAGTVVMYLAGYELPDETPPLLAAACLSLLARGWHAYGRDPTVRSTSTEGVGSTTYFDAPGAGYTSAINDPLVAAAVQMHRRVQFV